MQTLSYESLMEQWSTGVPANLLQQDGIKAQFASAAAVVLYLNELHKDGAWQFHSARVGGFEDTVIGVDGYLVNTMTRQAFAVDFSLESDANPRGNKRNCPWLVHVKRDWFDERPDGKWQLRSSCLKPLVRAFAPALANGPVAWQPLEAVFHGRH